MSVLFSDSATPKESILRLSENILLINRFFGNPQVPTGRMLADLAEKLVDQGHRVAILASEDDYGGVSDSERGTRSISIRRLKSVGPRWVRWPIFFLRASVASLFMHWDRCVILTDPPFLTVLAGLNNFFFRRQNRRVYWWTMDLYPEVLVAEGLISAKSWLCRVLRGLNEWGIQHMAGVIALDNKQRERLATYRHWKRAAGFAITVPPWDYRSLEKIPEHRNQFVRDNDLSGKKILLYAGNLGRAHTHRQVIETARVAMKRGSEWVFVFVCRGSGRKQLERDAEALPNVRVMDYVPPEQTADLLQSATVHVITMRPGWEGVCVPSKLYGILQTAGPVLYVGPLDSGTAEEIQRYQAGRVLPDTASGEQVLDAINGLANRRENVCPVSNDGPQKIARFITAPDDSSRKVSKGLLKTIADCISVKS